MISDLLTPIAARYLNHRILRELSVGFCVYDHSAFLIVGVLIVRVVKESAALFFLICHISGLERGEKVLLRHTDADPARKCSVELQIITADFKALDPAVLRDGRIVCAIPCECMEALASLDETDPAGIARHN